MMWHVNWANDVEFGWFDDVAVIQLMWKHDDNMTSAGCHGSTEDRHPEMAFLIATWDNKKVPSGTPRRHHIAPPRGFHMAYL
jgi:hypothetical protein